MHEGLVQGILQPYQQLRLSSMLARPPQPVPGDVLPLVKLAGQNVTLHTSYLNHSGWLVRDEYLPAFQAAAEHFTLPETYMLLWDLDTPPSPVNASGNAWGGYCSIRGARPSVMLPYRWQAAAFDVQAASRAGKKDKRSPKAVFLGSPTGWARGHRHTLARLRISNPDQVYAGITLSGGNVCAQCSEVDATELPGFMLPHVSLQEQVDSFKYIIQANGNCAAMRLRHLLSSDSAVFMLSSNEEEWFYPLLVPFRHYIPVMTNISPAPGQQSTDLIEMIQWAEANPNTVADIVSNAREFARHHLSELAQTCYLARLLHSYSSLVEQDTNVTMTASLQRSWSSAWKELIDFRT